MGRMARSCYKGALHLLLQAISSKKNLLAKNCNRVTTGFTNLKGNGVSIAVFTWRFCSLMMTMQISPKCIVTVEPFECQYSIKKKKCLTCCRKHRNYRTLSEINLMLKLLWCFSNTINVFTWSFWTGSNCSFPLFWTVLHLSLSLKNSCSTWLVKSPEFQMFLLDFSVVEKGYWLSCSERTPMGGEHSRTHTHCFS